ncbi:hypothetical protein SmJEL517_g03107 [Synchytrium microbalum]|uniref:Sulfotransferase domain-containing protein n=1 Tax=Synchytrium microbalum TaxID=1806994 RepID=A0A507C488_9FUNG|nr:uncharacterized protein SmJEL517_g03107 [Synchytrium microbalum]TPX34198.1 hypothetical protein SmJEL517_g03107 [Synchytrium microbalum]
MSKETKKVSPKGLGVIGAGLGRTGTSSLKLALAQIGFGECYHMQEVFKHPADAKIFNKAYNKEPVDWHAFFEGRGFHSTVDYPTCQYYEELMACYPDAKVLLSVRDAEKWHDSVMATIYQVVLAKPRGFDAVLHRWFSPPGIATMWDNPGLEDLGNFMQSGKSVADRENAVRLFNEWTERVKKTVPKDKLLVFDVKEGKQLTSQ